MINLWNFIRVIFREGMLKRTTSGERLGWFSRRAWGSNLMLTGVIALLVSTIWFVQRAYFEFDAVQTTSVVLEVNSSSGSSRRRQPVYQLTLGWTDQTGTSHVTIPSMRASYYNVPVGTELDIKYDPNDTTDVRVEPQNGPWYFPTLMLLGGIVSLLIGRVIRGCFPTKQNE